MSDIETGTVERQAREAVIDELKRQAEASTGRLSVSDSDDMLEVHGTINIDELVMAVVGSLAGGP